MIILEYVCIPGKFLCNKSSLRKLQHQIGEFLSVQYSSKGLFTNISHSGNTIICAVSNQLVGVDIEFIKDVPINEYEFSLFPEAIWSKIFSSKNPSLTFLQYWTMLESALKACRLGFNVDLKSINWDEDKGAIFINGEKWLIKNVNVLDSFICSVSCQIEDSAIEIKEREISTFALKMFLQNIDNKNF